MPSLDPNKLKIGYVILVATGKPAIEANVPRSRLVDLEKEYASRGFEIKVMRRKGQAEQARYKVALWWATMNNLPYDVLQFFWFPLSILSGKIEIILHNLFSSQKRFLCSELIATGFYKEGDYCFSKPAEQVLPADFDNPELFEEVKDICLATESFSRER